MEDSYWAAPQIKLLSEQGVIVGYPDGTFKPDANVTRAEFAAMAIRALGQQHTKVAQPVQFTDVNEEYWAYEDIQKALYFDLISSDKEGQLFRPEDSVSRAESTSIAVNALTTETISIGKAKEVLEKDILMLVQFLNGLSYQREKLKFRNGSCCTKRSKSSTGS